MPSALCTAQTEFLRKIFKVKGNLQIQDENWDHGNWQQTTVTNAGAIIASDLN
jgi:hypothetical protein